MRMLLFLLAFVFTPSLAFSDLAPLEITEEDLSPSTFPYQVKFTNGTVTDNGDGTTSVSSGASGGDPILIDGVAVSDASGVDLQGGTGVDITFSAAASPDTASFVFDSQEFESGTWGAGAASNNSWTFNVSGTDTKFTFESGTITELGVFISDGLTIGNDENLTIGSDTLTFASGTSDFELSDDLNLTDGDPHIQLIDNTASSDDYEIYADANQVYLTNVTDSKVIWKADGSNLINFYNREGFNFPDAAPSDDQILKYDSVLGRLNWEADAGGSATPGGSDTQVQFNDASTFGGDSGMTYNKTTDVLTLAGGLTMGEDDLITLGASTFTHDSTKADFVSSDDLSLEDANPQLILRDTSDNVAYSWHLNSGDVPWQVALWRGTDTGSGFNINTFFPLIGWDSSNVVYHPLGMNLRSSTSNNPTTDAWGELSADDNAWIANRGAMQFHDGIASTYILGALVSDVPVHGETPMFNQNGTITWEAGSGTAGGWTDDGTEVRLAAPADEVEIGSAGALSAKLAINGDTDEIQFLVQGNSTQTTSLIVAENSGGTDQMTLSNAGTFVAAGSGTFGGGQAGQSTIDRGLLINDGGGSGTDSDFHVEGDTDTDLITADASADKVGISIAQGSQTALLHVDDSSTGRASIRIDDGTAPTSPNEGDLWNDATQNAFIAFLSGVKQTIPGVLFTATADATHGASTTETTIVGTGVGTLTLPANFFVAGKSIRFNFRGFKSSDSATPGTLTLALKLGSTTIETTTVTITAGGTANAGWEADYLTTCRTTGATGTVYTQGKFIHQTSTVGAIDDLVETGTVTVDTTASAAIDLTADWSISDAENTMTTTHILVEVLN